MAGNAKGAAIFQVGDQQFKWEFTVGAICALEEHLGLGVLAITAELQSWLPPTKVVDGRSVSLDESAEEIKARNARVRMSFARAVFWAGLQEHQPGTSIKAAGDLITEVGGLIPALGIIVQGLGAAMPDAPVDAENPPARPRKASRKTAG